MSRSPLVANTLAFTRVTVTAPGTAEQQADVKIPDGYVLVVKNRLGNAGNFYLGPTAAAAQSSTGARKVLEPGESITLHQDNTNRLFVDADNATDALELTIERIS